MKRKLLLVFLIGVGVGAGGVLLYQYLWRANTVRIPTTNPAAEPWAEPLEKPGLENLHRVSTDLYRGAQPAAEGFRQLKAMGVRTVVNLRNFSSDRDGIGETGLGYEHIYSTALHVEANEVVRFLQIVTDPARTPVFVHCKLGSDRTGTMCAIYRVAVQGWSKEDAIEEMTRGGFGFHEWFDNLIEFIRELDIEDMKRRAGVTTRPASGKGGSSALRASTQPTASLVRMSGPRPSGRGCCQGERAGVRLGQPTAQIRALPATCGIRPGRRRPTRIACRSA